MRENTLFLAQVKSTNNIVEVLDVESSGHGSVYIVRYPGSTKIYTYSSRQLSILTELEEKEYYENTKGIS